MKAILLAAGIGQRLQGAAGGLPKPMVSVRGKPVLQHNVEWLKGYGVSDIVINLHHLPDVIRSYFGDGSRFGVSITYSFERELLGTAGAVRKIADDLWKHEGRADEGADDFLVAYGDNLFELDLKAVLDYHRERDGIATVALHERDDVSQSGIVVLDEKGRLSRFIEKPAPEQAVGRLVNAGLYVLNARVLPYIAAGAYADFGLHIFPALLAKGEPVFGVRVKGAVTPIDTPELLRRVSLHRGFRSSP